MVQIRNSAKMERKVKEGYWMCGETAKYIYI